MTAITTTSGTRAPRKRNPAPRPVFLATVLKDQQVTYTGVAASYDGALRLAALHGTQWSESNSHTYEGEYVSPADAITFTFGANLDEREGFLIVPERYDSTVTVTPLHLVHDGEDELDTDSEAYPLYSGLPGCVHLLDSASGGGVKCVRPGCDGWYCA